MSQKKNVMARKHCIHYFKGWGQLFDQAVKTNTNSLMNDRIHSVLTLSIAGVFNANTFNLAHRLD